MTLKELAYKEPARLAGYIVAAVVPVLGLLGVAFDAVQVENLTGFITGLVMATSAIIGMVEYVRSKVGSPETTDILSEGTLSRRASEEAKKRATEILNAPPPPREFVPDWLKESAQTIAGMTPGEIDDFVLKYGLDALEAAVELAQRAPTSQEMTDRYIDKAKAK